MLFFLDRKIYFIQSLSICNPIIFSMIRKFFIVEVIKIKKVKKRIKFCNNYVYIKKDI